VFPIGGLSRIAPEHYAATSLPWPGIFRAFENNACLQAFLNVIVMISFAINSYLTGTFCHMEILSPGPEVVILNGARRSPGQSEGEAE